MNEMSYTFSDVMLNAGKACLAQPEGVTWGLPNYQSLKHYQVCWTKNVYKYDMQVFVIIKDVFIPFEPLNAA